MVGMAMRDEDGGRRQAVLLQVIDDLLPVHAGIDHEAIGAAIAMEDVSIFSEFCGNYSGEANWGNGGRCHELISLEAFRSGKMCRLMRWRRVTLGAFVAIRIRGVKHCNRQQRNTR